MNCSRKTMMLVIVLFCAILLLACDLGGGASGGQQPPPSGGQQPPPSGGQQPSAGKPDLVITEAKFVPDPVVVGQPFKAEFKIENRGDAPTGPFTVFWAFHEATGLKGCCSRDFANGLAAKGWGGGTFADLVTNSQPGQSPSWVEVDYGNRVEEGTTGEANNKTDLTFVVKAAIGGGSQPSTSKPDLDWTEFKTPDKKNVGDNLFVNVTMKNVGTKATGPFSVCYEIVGPSGAVVHQETKSYSSLDPDHYNTGSWPFGDKYVAPTAGTYSFRGNLDCQTQVDESNEGNNRETAQLAVVAQGGATAPAAPTNLSLGTQTFNLTTFTVGAYDNAENEDGFYLYVNGTRRATIPVNLGKGQMTIFLHQLLPGAFSCNQTYKFQVSASNAAGESARSNEFSWTVKCQP